MAAVCVDYYLLIWAMSDFVFSLISNCCLVVGQDGTTVFACYLM